MNKTKSYIQKLQERYGEKVEKAKHYERLYLASRESIKAALAEYDRVKEDDIYGVKDIEGALSDTQIISILRESLE